MLSTSDYNMNEGFGFFCSAFMEEGGKQGKINRQNGFFVNDLIAFLAYYSLWLLYRNYSNLCYSIPNMILYFNIII